MSSPDQPPLLFSIAASFGGGGRPRWGTRQHGGGCRLQLVRCWWGLAVLVAMVQEPGGQGHVLREGTILPVAGEEGLQVPAHHRVKWRILRVG